MVISIERHRVDGFTLYGSDKYGYLVSQRYIGYSVAEAKRLFREYVREQESKIIVGI